MVNTEIILTSVRQRFQLFKTQFPTFQENAGIRCKHFAILTCNAPTKLGRRSEANTEAPPEGVATGCKNYVDKAGMFDGIPSLQVWRIAEIVVDC